MKRTPTSYMIIIKNKNNDFEDLREAEAVSIRTVRKMAKEIFHDEYENCGESRENWTILAYKAGISEHDFNNLKEV